MPFRNIHEHVIAKMMNLQQIVQNAWDRLLVPCITPLYILPFVFVFVLFVVVFMTLLVFLLSCELSLRAILYLLYYLYMKKSGNLASI